MTNAALFVDLPNFYSRLLKSEIETPRFLRDYFLYGLDFDLLAKRLTDNYSGIWVFYSGERIGPSSERIVENYLINYVSRINGLEGVTAKDVNIPGQQREPVAYICEECGHEGVSESKAEKGIDASLTVHLFDTMDSWDIAYLLSGDADFVPAVASLRRRGKIVIGAGFSDASPALIRECYDYIDLTDAFLKEDIAIYTLFKKGGIADRWLTDELKCEMDTVPSNSAELRMRWYPRRIPSSQISPTPGRIMDYIVYFEVEGTVDITNRQQFITEFQAKFADKVMIETQTNTQANTKTYVFTISLSAWESAPRKLQKFRSSAENISISKSGGGGELYEIKYQYDSNTKKYKLPKGSGVDSG